MLRKFKTSITTIMISMGFLMPSLVATAVYAETGSAGSLGAATATSTTAPNDATSASAGACSGANLDLSGSTNCNATDQSADTDSLNNIITYVLNIFSVVVGLVAVIMIIVGGLKYIISGGESGKVSGAKDTILFAIVGLVVVVLAQIIVRFVLSNVSSKAGLGS
jgi:hypothetical protein